MLSDFRNQQTRIQQALDLQVLVRRNSPLGEFVVNRKGEFLEINETFLKQMRYVFKSWVVGDGAIVVVHDFVPPELKEEHKGWFESWWDDPRPLTLMQRGDKEFYGCPYHPASSQDEPDKIQLKIEIRPDEYNGEPVAVGYCIFAGTFGNGSLE